MSEGQRADGAKRSKKGRDLPIALGLDASLAAAEAVGGLVSGSLVSGSLPLLGDAAHNGSDAASILISYVV